MSLKEANNCDIEGQSSAFLYADTIDGRPRQDDYSPETLYPNQFKLPEKLRLMPYQGPLAISGPLLQEMQQKSIITDKCIQKWEKNAGIVSLNSSIKCLPL